jgi:hypothetical protein
LESFNEFLLVGGLIVFIVIGFFVFTILLSNKRHEIEVGKAPFYIERCGAQFGILTVTYPFVRISLYDEFMVISCFSRKIIEYDKIRRIEEESGILAREIELVTISREIYGRPTIWTLNNERLGNLIREKAAPFIKKRVYKHSTKYN